MFERRNQPLLPRGAYFRRVSRHAVVGCSLVALTLGIGMAGYHWLEGLGWLDAYLNAAMILGGMGPVSELHTTASKLFAGAYALFSGVVLLVAVGVLLSPVVHRALHRFHLDEDDEVKGRARRPRA